MRLGGFGSYGFGEVLPSMQGIIELQISNEKVTKAIQRLGCSSTEAFATAAAFEAADAIAA
jgi:hypothetical protein